MAHIFPRSAANIKVRHAAYNVSKHQAGRHRFVQASQVFDKVHFSVSETQGQSRHTKCIQCLFFPRAFSHFLTNIFMRFKIFRSAFTSLQNRFSAFRSGCFPAKKPLLSLCCDFPFRCARLDFCRALKELFQILVHPQYQIKIRSHSLQ